MKGFRFTIVTNGERLDSNTEFVASDILIQASHSNSDVIELVSIEGGIIELVAGQTVSIAELGARDDFFFLSKNWTVNGTAGDRLNVSYKGNQ